MTDINQKVDEFNDEARELETRLEELGKSICNIPGSGASWAYVNAALESLRKAICNTHLMYTED